MALVIASGASELHDIFEPDVLPGILRSYMDGLKAAFLVALIFCGCAFLCSFAIPMKKLPSHTIDGDEPEVDQGVAAV